MCVLADTDIIGQSMEDVELRDNATAPYNTALPSTTTSSDAVIPAATAPVPESLLASQQPVPVDPPVAQNVAAAVAIQHHLPLPVAAPLLQQPLPAVPQHDATPPVLPPLIAQVPGGPVQHIAAAPAAVPPVVMPAPAVPVIVQLNTDHSNHIPAQVIPDHVFITKLCSDCEGHAVNSYLKFGCYNHLFCDQCVEFPELVLACPACHTQKGKRLLRRA